ncbi:hypothetical protein ACJ73_07803 [Blastomyces percursus]|uniref:HTH CENPB-type domain-containing protein n=1 Tax=Blastomyces percursus TaxID=1658174 RepID=A0A1J9PY76_9EURO|nr:hypothetical protein ACJ73_07803 [Blastomyces percursus]
MANLLLEKRGDGNLTPTGPNWVTNFFQRHPEIKSKFVRKFNYFAKTRRLYRTGSSWYKISPLSCPDNITGAKELNYPLTIEEDEPSKPSPSNTPPRTLSIWYVGLNVTCTSI